MATVDPADVTAQMRWRYATKTFDPAAALSADQWDAIERSLVQSPSSFGLQPWRFVAVASADVRRRMRAVAWDQSQVTDASHLVVVASRVGFGVADVDRHLAHTAAVQGVPVEKLAGLRGMIVGFLAARDPAATDAWCRCQAYLAVGTALTAAAMVGVDACPMEGFDAKAVDDMLGLPAAGYTAAVALAFGHRAATDKYAAMPKVRYDPADVIARV